MSIAQIETSQKIFWLNQAINQINEEQNFQFEDELQVLRNKSESYVGSDAWLDIVMNFNTETEGIETCWQEFLNYSEIAPTDSIQSIREFHRLVADWMESQVAFCLSENGCGKFLSIQPSYFFEINQHNDSVIVSPAGLKSFGDQAKRYEQTNDLVGQGLKRLYEGLAQAEIGDWALIVSPTEQYQDYNSTTDVINIMKVVGQTSEGAKIVEAKYVVVGRVLNEEERRFLHNLCVTQSQNSQTIDSGKSIIASELMVQNGGVSGLSESEQLVAYPTVFKYNSQTDNSVYDLVIKLNNIFKNRFSIPLIEQTDINMYHFIKELTSKNLDNIMQSVIYKPSKQDYYNLLRTMIYKSQLEWAKIMYANQNGLIFSHIDNLLSGRLIVGFEFGDLSGNQWGFENSWTTSYQEASYCKKHKKNYIGESCPKCNNL